MLMDAIDLSSTHRVLVIKLRHHGDVLLTSPVFSVLKNHAPHLEIDALVYQDTADMLTLHPAINTVHGIDQQWKKRGLMSRIQAEWVLLKELRARRYDMVVHLTTHPRGAWLKRWLGARVGVAPTAPGKGRCWNNSFSHFYAQPRGKPRHTVELHLDALRRLGIYPTEVEKRLVLVPGDEAENTVSALLRRHALVDRDFVHIHPTSRWLFKCCPPENMAALITALQAQGLPVVITAAPARQEMDMVRAILGQLTQPVIDLSAQLNLKQLAALTARAMLFIGVDSAPMHIAAAMQTPTVALFGPSGDQEWGPWRVPSRIITADVSCRPCGNDGCGGGKVSECLQLISVDAMVAAAQALLTG